MSEKKVLAKITERLKHFEEYEQRCTASLLTLKDDYIFDEQVLEMARSIRRIDYLKNAGDLAVLYETFLKYAEEIPSEKRKEPEFVERKYMLYIDALRAKRDYPKGYFKPDDYIV